MGVVGDGFGGRGAEGGAGVVEILVLKPAGHVRDRLPLGGGQVGAVTEKRTILLALADRVPVVAELAKDGAGVAVMADAV